MKQISFAQAEHQNKKKVTRGGQARPSAHRPGAHAADLFPATVVCARRRGARCCVSAKRGAIKKMDDSPMKTLLLAIEKAKASIRAKVEHPFHVIKNLFGYRKVRYKGLAKNHAQLFSLFGLANLVL